MTPFPLEALQTAWLPRQINRIAALPGLNNSLGSLQIEADIAAIKHPVFPFYSGGNEIIGLTLLNGKNLALQTPQIEIRWRAYEVERRCQVGGWTLESRTSLLPNQPGALVQVRVVSRHADSQPLSLAFLLSGRAMNTGSDGYAWAVPSIPTDVFGFTKTEGLKQTITQTDVPHSRCFSNDAGNAHAVQSVWSPPQHWARGRIPTWETRLNPGESFVVNLLLTFHESRAEATALNRQWYGQDTRLFEQARAWWEQVWESAFTPENGMFSGSLPVLESPEDALNRLYYTDVLTALTCRREYAACPYGPVYLTLWPRRGEGSGYLAWELPYTSGILARLDPAALKQAWLLLAAAPELDYQVTNFFRGTHGGWPCCAQPQAIHTAALNLVRWTGDLTWRDAPITRVPKTAQGFVAASQGQITQTEGGEMRRLTGLDAFREMVLFHRQCHLPGKAIIDYGNRGAYLECISNYSHGTAGHTAVQVRALREAHSLLGENLSVEAAALEQGVLSLYRLGEGYFDCEEPSGERIPAPNLYDIGLVLNAMGERLPKTIVDEIVGFTRRELLTPTWAHCLWPSDVDVTSGIRGDHQWAGCFSGWIPQYILGLLRANVRESWMVEWLTGVAKVTAQGPFAQAYWSDDVYPLEAGAAAKCYDELTQGNHWVIGSGTYFAEMVLDGILGLNAEVDGQLTLHTGLEPWASRSELRGIRHGGRTYRLIGHRLIEDSAGCGNIPQRHGVQRGNRCVTELACAVWQALITQRLGAD